MKDFTGKTYSILKRLPHFFHEVDQDVLLAKLADVFGKRLEKTEQDLFKILKSHHMETADNEGSKGYIAADELRGDLDKIFAFYLEILGGTSQLIKLNPDFTISVIDTKAISKVFLEDESELISEILNIIKNEFPSLYDLLKRYHVNNAKINKDEIGSWFVKHLIMGESHNKTKSPVSKYIKAKIDKIPGIIELFGSYGGGETVQPRLKVKIVEFLNDIILNDISFFTENYEHFICKDIGDDGWYYINRIYKDFLLEQYSKIEDNTEREIFINKLSTIEAIEMPPGDDLQRLNRILLETEYKYEVTNECEKGLKSSEIPSLDIVRDKIIEVFNKLLKREDLFSKTLFSDMEEDYDLLVEKYSERVEWLNRILFETIFTSEIEKSYIAYRERMKGLIKVLLEGASTKQGIIDIVAVNLGILGIDSRSQNAKDKIEIEEYDPEEKVFFNGSLRINEKFVINNPSPIKEKFEIVLSVLNELSHGLSKIIFKNLDTGEKISYEGEIKKDYKIVFRDGAVFIGEREKAKCEIPYLENGDTNWIFQIWAFDENGVSRPVGVYDTGSFLNRSVLVTDEPIISIDISSRVYSPGVFSMVIPWHIPGFTDLFEESEDHPRHLILSLVNKVKAAGVKAYVSYKQDFTETHNIDDKLNLKINGELLNHSHLFDEKFEIDIRNNNAELHDQSDLLSLDGRFDYTKFDSLNKFK